MMLNLYPRQEKFLREQIPKRKASEFVRMLINVSEQAIDEGQLDIIDVLKGRVKVCNSDNLKSRLPLSESVKDSS